MSNCKLPQLPAPVESDYDFRYFFKKKCFIQWESGHMFAIEINLMQLTYMCFSVVNRRHAKTFNIPYKVVTVESIPSKALITVSTY